MKLIYLASPYLYRGPYIISEMAKAQVHEFRYQKAIDAAAYLMNKGLAVYSPIVATHPIAVKHSLPLGSEYWMQFDEIILNKCDEIVVLTIEGWDESLGVSKEIDIARALNKNVTYLDPEELNK